MGTRHFLTLLDIEPATLEKLLDRAIELKTMLRKGVQHEPFRNKVLGMIFEKSSTRTRVSFESAMLQCGGGAIFLSPRDTQLGRGEPVADTARVLSRMVDIIMIRTFEHEKIETFARYSQVPVINALTDTYHPCQLLADLQCVRALVHLAEFARWVRTLGTYRAWSESQTATGTAAAVETER